MRVYPSSLASSRAEGTVRPSGGPSRANYDLLFLAPSPGDRALAVAAGLAAVRGGVALGINGQVTSICVTPSPKPRPDSFQNSLSLTPPNSPSPPLLQGSLVRLANGQMNT
jgi:hypothetical protein